MLSPAAALLGRNVLTGAVFSALASDTHVASFEGEEVVPRKAPPSFMATGYVGVSSVTWTEWGDEYAEGYARISYGHPSWAFGAEGGRVRMRLSCPVSPGDGFTYFGAYTVTWLSPPQNGVDGWEDGGVFSVFGDACGSGER